LRSIKIAIFGNFRKQNVAKNGKTVTQVPIEGQSSHFIAILKLLQLLVYDRLIFLFGDNSRPRSYQQSLWGCYDNYL